MLFAATGCGTTNSGASIRVTLGGAQIPVEFVESWLHNAKSSHFAPTKASPIYLSQHGFRNLASGECDIACTDRLITPRELKQFADRKLQVFRIAFYGYALYVHPDNPLDAIFAKHVRMVFQKRITDWKGLVGEGAPHVDGPIHLYGPPKGTRGGMILSPLAKIWFADATWEILDSDAEIVARVAEDPNALGFAGIGYDDQARYLGLRMKRWAAPAFPSLEEIESERYGLAKLVYVYSLAPSTPEVQAVLDYLLSGEGQTAIESTNLWPIPQDRAAVSALP